MPQKAEPPLAEDFITVPLKKKPLANQAEQPTKEDFLSFGPSQTVPKVYGKGELPEEFPQMLANIGGAALPVVAGVATAGESIPIELGAQFLAGLGKEGLQEHTFDPMKAAIDSIFNTAFDRAAGFAAPRLGEVLRNTSTLPAGSIKDLGTQIAGQTLGKLLSKQVPQADAEIAFKLFSDRAAPSVGQATGSTMAKFAESTVAKGAKLEREAAQQAEIPEKLAIERSKILTVPKQSTESLGGAAQPGLLAHKAELKDVENLAFKTFRENAPVNEFDVVSGYTQPQRTGVLDQFGKEVITPPQPIHSLKSVEAPVLLFKAQSFAKRIKPSIDSMFTGEAWEQTPPIVQSTMLRIKSTVDDLARGTDIIKEDGTISNLPLKEWSTVKEFRTLINSKEAKESFKNLEEGGLTHLANLAGRDIENSAKDWDAADVLAGLAGGHSARLAKANQATKILHTVFNNEVLKNSMFKKGDVFDLQDPSQIFKRAYKSPEATRRLMTALPEDSRELMRADYFDNVLMKGFRNEGARTYSPDKVINELSDINSVSRELFTSSERNAWIDVMRAVRSVAPSETNNKAFWFRGGQFLLSFTGAGAASLIAGGFRTGVAVGAAGLTAMVISNEGVKHLFFNPQVARMAAGLVKTPAGAAGTAFAQKQIMRVLRGTQVVLNLPNGDTETGTVQDNGTVKIQ